MTEQSDALATPWSGTALPVPQLPAVDGPPELARVDVTPRAGVPAQRTQGAPETEIAEV